MDGRASRSHRPVQALLLTLCAVAIAAIGLRAADGPARQVTFSKDVAPIFQAKCQECHQPNSIAPMSLITFDDSRPWARSDRPRGAGKRRRTMQYAWHRVYRHHRRMRRAPARAPHRSASRFVTETP